MKYWSYIAAVLVTGTGAFSAQMTLPLASSHAPVTSHAPASKAPKAAASQASTASSKPAVRVNGAVLTETDVLREMYTIFPYGRQHNGFPKELEADIRRGAIDMIVFEELLYQEAKRRNITIPPERVAKSQAAFRGQFPDKAMYQDYLRAECNGSTQVLKEKIRRSLLIEKMLKTEVEQKAQVSPTEIREYYDKNSRQFERGETVAIQTISIIPPENASAKVKAEAKAKITDIVRLGRAAKTSRDFGLIAEQLSEDDWRTKLGDRGTVDVKNLPPEIVKAARAMKAGQVSDAIQVDRAWVVIRLNSHTPAGRTPFAKAKAKLQSDLQKQKKQEVRAALNQKLRKDAKIELL